MFLLLAVFASLAYVVALVLMYTTPVFIHLLLIFALIFLVFHLVRRRRA